MSVVLVGEMACAKDVSVTLENGILFFIQTLKWDAAPLRSFARG